MERYRIGTKKIEMPSGWHDVSFEDGLILTQNEDWTSTRKLAHLAKVSEDEIRKATDPETIHYFYSSFLFVDSSPIDDKPEMPRSVKLGHDEIIVLPFSTSDTFDLGECEVGQVEDMKEVVLQMSAKFKEDIERDLTALEVMKISPMIVAIYLQNKLDRSYDYKRAKQLVTRIEKEMSFKDVLNISAFFLRKLSDLMRGLNHRSPIPFTMKRKFALASKRLIRHFAFMSL